MNSLNKGFSLAEIIIAITVSSVFVVFIVASTFFLYRSLNRSQEKSEKISRMAEFIKTVSIDVYNSDIFPHHQVKDYSYNSNSIVFFANGKKVQYDFSEGTFYVTKNEDKKEFKFISDFKISYYDRDGLMVFEDGLPYYCEMVFVFYDKKEVKLDMRM
jgi:prepilin-type N-terminal cleavage/methylation domain-containing protein